MDERYCPFHKQPCFLKTCTTVNSLLYTKSFYICPLWPNSCDFKRPANFLPSVCPLHENSIVELQQVKSVQTESGCTEKRNYFRCKKQKEVKQKWCSFYVVSLLRQENKENVEAKKVFSVNSFYSKRNQAKAMPYSDEKNVWKGDESVKPKEKPTLVKLERKLEWKSPNVDSFRKPLPQPDAGVLDIPRKAPSGSNDSRVKLLHESSGKFRENNANGICSLNGPKIIPSLSELPQSNSTVETGGNERPKKVNDDLAEGSIVDHKLIALEKKLQLHKNLKSSVNLASLPDKGARIISAIAETEANIMKLKCNSAKSEKCVVETKNENSRPSASLSKPPATTSHRQTKLLDYVTGFLDKNSLKQNYAVHSQHQSLYGGAMNKFRLAMVKSVTEEAVEKLHKSLQSCPLDNIEELDPSLLVTTLMPHQRQALAWMLWREKQDPPGGILADDMGLGKTLTMISLILKTKELTDQEGLKHSEWFTKEGVVSSNATLVVCPASLLHQWAQEIEIHCKRLALSVLIYHGVGRDKNLKKIAKHNVVITTYATVSRELGSVSKSQSTDSPVVQANVSASHSSLLRIAWLRVILDEAHNIKNPKSITCQSICQLRAGRRWALTGTPIHNKLLDMYSLLRFLRCSPFDELKVWKKWVDNNSEQGTTRLNTLVKSLMLRRTKDQKNDQGLPLFCLPTKKTETHMLELCGKEKSVYDKLMAYSRSAVEEMLKKQEEKKMGESIDFMTAPGRGTVTNNTMVLVLLLRLQQCCGHLGLLRKVSVETKGDIDDDDLIRRMECLDIKEHRPHENNILEILSEYKYDLEFQDTYPSTKVSALLSRLEAIKKSGSGKEKCVIVSQWTSMLKLIGLHLKKNGYSYHLIQGDVKPEDRTRAVDDFNRNAEGARVMMLSLKAGGVGLNLIGGNHLFIIDLHWNPALENQACDRIYRVGQKKNVFIHRFVCCGTIEERISLIQESKASLAKDVLEGGAEMRKLTWNDMKLLFDLR